MVDIVASYCDRACEIETKNSILLACNILLCYSVNLFVELLQNIRYSCVKNSQYSVRTLQPVKVPVRHIHACCHKKALFCSWKLMRGNNLGENVHVRKFV